MKKIPCDVYSRVVGYYQPVRFWNPGKQEEFKERVPFDLSGNKFKEKFNAITHRIQTKNP